MNHPEARLDLSMLSQQLGEASVPLLRELYHLLEHDLSLALVLGELGRTNAGRRIPSARHNQCHDLSLATGIPRATVRRKLHKLQSLGWLETDARGRLALTPLAREQWSDINRRFWARLRQALAHLEE
ncbi:helix-turn-helix domain-containing protein [Paludibacterium purpuratum]|uniref:IclR-like helix-turn-helix domain-containing protein n=1 Tax=Paludibacterium purpuratum TaxID=1144873 RepID=A0A4R7B5K7_9NEIS|nr:helix-turn-helix domain-containing protein [Paludibacterium purpuratum]TDR79954.1 IclR-like helix-turn-helix domain-containing protein [Paludibacterium purpuratum]